MLLLYFRSRRELFKIYNNKLHCHAIIPHSNAAFLYLLPCFIAVHHPQCCLTDEIHAREHILTDCIHRRKVFQIFHILTDHDRIFLCFASTIKVSQMIQCIKCAHKSGCIFLFSKTVEIKRLFRVGAYFTDLTP